MEASFNVECIHQLSLLDLSSSCPLLRKGKGYCYADPLVIVPARTCAKKLTSKAQIMETHSCELHPLHSIFAFFAQPAQGASQPASTHPSRATCFPWWRLFFSFLMTYYMCASLLLVVSIDAGRDYRAPVQNRCSKGPLRPRSVSSPYPRLVLTPRFRLLFLLLLFRDMRTASEVWLRRCNTDAASGPPGASASVHA